MKNLLNEELKRFKQIINYNPEEGKLINEAFSSHVQKITNKLSEDLPLNEYSSAIDSITLLQKVLVALGFLKKSYGIDGDGVDGDFGGDTKNALNSAIGDKELNSSNIKGFSEKMETSQTKLVNTYSNWQTFFEKYKKQGGVKSTEFNQCKEKTTFKDKEWVISKKTCYPIKEMAKTLNSVMGDYGIIAKSSVLSVMIKEQGKGTYICALNNNYAGIQTDSGGWGEGLNSLMNGQFCKKDKERLRTFASFDELKNGLSFISKSFENKGWFNVVNELSDEEVDVDKVDVENVANINADKWQTDWNLKLDDANYKLFKDNGYNSKLKDTTFTNDKGIYTKSVKDLNSEEKKKHESKVGTFRSPEKIKQSWDSMNKYFKLAFNTFKDIEENATSDVGEKIGNIGSATIKGVENNQKDALDAAKDFWDKS